MTWTGIIAVYIVLWWVVFFAILPIGVRSQDESGEITPGTDPGAPKLTNLRTKVWWTTIASAIVFAVFYGAYATHLIDVDKIIKLWSVTPI